MIESIIFDFDATLVDYQAIDRKAMYSVAELANHNIDAEQFYEQSGVIAEELNSGIAKYDSMIHRERLLQTFKYFQLKWSEEYIERYLSVYLNEVVVFAGVLPFLEAIKGKVKIGLLTNAVDIYEQKRRIAISGLEKYFDVICISGEIGVSKPEESAFLFVLNKLGVDPGKSVFIGDSEENDVVGANQVGMITVRKCSPKRKSSARYTFTDYSELQPIMKMIGVL